ncbi:TetR/AcrR family transcriptional regulator [Streptomyces sp. NPDC041068]|uniref:TetR/AcrR family transcriptional regulator n=1 Tax=Streptomyces sp. NPDC041068 TaxID=3155130 RepID=UPI0033C9D682
MQLRAEQTRQALIAAAAELISTKGLKDTGLVEIHTSAGVSKGALYFHFSGKEDLADALHSETHERLSRLAERHLRGKEPDAASIAGFLVELFGEMRTDTVLRAGLRLESEKRPHDFSGPPPLRAKWLDYLQQHFTSTAGDRAVSDLLCALSAGLEALGHNDPYWWKEETVKGICALLTELVDTASPGALPPA